MEFSPRNYIVEIKPALEVERRHEIEAALEKLGSVVHGGGTCTDGSSCDISISRPEK